jgi:hypothetical protein
MLFRLRDVHGVVGRIGTYYHPLLCFFFLFLLLTTSKRFFFYFRRPLQVKYILYCFFFLSNFVDRLFTLSKKTTTLCTSTIATIAPRRGLALEHTFWDLFGTRSWREKPPSRQRIHCVIYRSTTKPVYYARWR